MTGLEDGQSARDADIIVLQVESPQETCGLSATELRMTSAVCSNRRNILALRLYRSCHRRSSLAKSGTGIRSRSTSMSPHRADSFLQALAGIRERLRDGIFRPGERIAATKVADLLGLSATPTHRFRWERPLPGRMYSPASNVRFPEGSQRGKATEAVEKRDCWASMVAEYGWPGRFLMIEVCC
jgi:hypothetical protein